MPIDAARAKSLFLAASDLADAAERAAYLDRECGGDTELRGRVEALLRANDGASLDGDRTGAFVPEEPENPVLGAPSSHRSRDERAGAVIAGKYTLVEPIGEGGMGSVWRAKQSEPVKRFVAVKLIKAGMDSKQVLARFEAERQALALMDHPNIAKVLDGGLHEHRPYFVMELVKGVPITEYCDATKLTPQQRLELFVPVCQAIQHAHQKGIIHRDIKPSNVLVALYDDRPVVKVIDFGVAKATGGTLTEATIDTGIGGIVGTPQYMSPEQATFNNLDIDTRSDVYALGVLLYELLAGSPPFSKKELEKKGLLEMLRVVREEEPPRPSTKLSTADALPSLSANRGTEPKKLTGLLRNELDWVVMKALEKDRTRRYETANGFAADVLRYLAGEAVQAHPPSTTYRLKKFVKRNKVQVIAASLVLLTLLGGIAGTSWGLYREAQRAEGERLAKLDAQEKQKFAEGINRFVVDDFLALTSVEGQERFGGEGKQALSKDTTLRQLLDRAAQKLRAQQEKRELDPRIEAELCWIIGVNYRGQGEAALGVPFLERCVALRRECLGSDHEQTLDAQNSLALCYNVAGKLELAIQLHKETLELRKVKLGADHRDTLVSMGNLARAYSGAGQLDKALPLFEKTLELHKAKLGADHSDTLVCMNNLVVCYQTAGKYAEAISMNEEVVKVSTAKLGPDHTDTLVARNTLAAAYINAGKNDKALTLQEETIRLQKAKLGPDHADTLTSINNLAMGYLNAGEYDKAVPLLEEALKFMKVKHGPDHPETLTVMNNLAECYRAVGRLDKTVPLLEETFRLQKATLGADHPSTLATMSNLAMGYEGIGKPDKAMPLMEEAVKLYKAKLGPEHPNTLVAINNLAMKYQFSGQIGKALPLFEATLKLQKAKIGPDHADTLVTMNNLARAYQALGQFDKAIPMLEEVVEIRKAKFGPDHPETLATMHNLGLGYLDAKQFDKALPPFEEVLKIRKTKLGPDHPETLSSFSTLGWGYRCIGQTDKALPLFEEAAKGVEKGGFRQEDAHIIIANAINAYDEAKQYDRADDWRRRWFAFLKKNGMGNSAGYAGELATWGTTLLVRREYAEAEPLLRECLAIREKTQPDDWRTFNTKSLLGGALLGQKKYADAEPLLLNCYEGMKSREEMIPKTGGAELRIPEALDRLIELYTATNKPDEVKKWQEERAKYPPAKTPEEKK